MKGWVSRIEFVVNGRTAHTDFDTSDTTRSLAIRVEERTVPRARRTVRVEHTGRDFDIGQTKLSSLTVCE